MTGRIIHVGLDEQFRVPVLENAGYLVDICLSVDSFQASLVASPGADAIAITDNAPKALLKAASLVLATHVSTVPLIYFKGSSADLDDSDFDLAIPPLTPPVDWVAEVEKLIAERRALRANSKALCEASAALQRNSARLREASATVVQESRSMGARIKADRESNDRPY